MRKLSRCAKNTRQYFTITNETNRASIMCNNAKGMKLLAENADGFTGETLRVFRLRAEDVYGGRRIAEQQGRRAEILSSTLRHGAMWEREQVQQIRDSMDAHIMALRTPSAKAMHQKARLGAKAVKQLERNADEPG